MNTLESIWIAIAIALTNATQVRMASFPLGIGEVMILIWLLFLLKRIIICQYHFMTSLVKVNFWFWLLTFSFLNLGLLIADAMGLKASKIDHDCLAFLFIAITSIGFSLSETFYHETKKIIFYFLSFTLVFLFIIFCFPSVTPFLDSWYGGVRFTGWAENPNQLALLLSAIPFLILHILSISKNTILKAWYVLLLIVCLILGKATDSDAMLVSWVAGFGTLFYLIIINFLINFFTKKIKADIKRIYQKILGIFFIMISMGAISIIHQTISSLSTNVYDKDSQGSARMTLWKHGITAISHSPLFGLGPGAHSGETGPFLDFEAHNTFIDWGASTGIMGLIAYVSLLAWIAWNAWQQKYIFLFVAVISLAGFSTFHYVLRHPIFWFYLQVIMTLSQKPSKSFQPILVKGFNPHF